MIIKCPHCNRQAKLNESLYPNKILRIKCKGCFAIWLFDVDEKRELTSPMFISENLDAEIKEAQRISRLIVSEIKLYNQDLIHKIKAKSELLEKLKEDLTLARQHYKQRVSPKLPPFPDYFQEAVETILLADKE